MYLISTNPLIFIHKQQMLRFPSCLSGSGFAVFETPLLNPLRSGGSSHLGFHTVKILYGMN